MINWWHIGGNALWILGAATLFATWSYHRYLARQRAASMMAGFFARLGILLVALGFAVTSESWLERSIWTLFLLAALLELGASLWFSQRARQKRRLHVQGDERQMREN